MIAPRVNRKPAVLQPSAAAIGSLALLLATAAAGLGVLARAQSAAPSAAPSVAQASAQSASQPVAVTPSQPPSSAQTATAATPSPAPTSESVSNAPAKAAAESSGDAQKPQIDGQCADLLKMANALKSEVDKTTMDVLSVSVVREADEIEQLARKMKGELKFTEDK